LEVDGGEGARVDEEDEEDEKDERERKKDEEKLNGQKIGGGPETFHSLVKMGRNDLFI
jgi:hypothetical protein